MRTHRAKSAHLPAEYITPTFSTRTPPPPFPQVDGGAAIEKNFLIFIFLIFARNLSGLCIEKIFYFFQIVVLCSFDYDLDLLHVVENYGFDIISRFRISDSILRLVFLFFFYFLDSFLLASISTCFSIVDSML